MNQTTHNVFQLVRTSFSPTEGAKLAGAAVLLLASGASSACSGIDQAGTTGDGGSPDGGNYDDDDSWDSSCGDAPFTADPPEPRQNTGKMTVSSPDGVKELIGVHCQAIPNWEGEIVGYVASFTDKLPEPDYSFRVMISAGYTGDGEYLDAENDGVSGAFYEWGEYSESDYYGLQMNLTISDGGLSGTGEAPYDDIEVEWECDPTSITSTDAQVIPETPVPGTAHYLVYESGAASWVEPHLYVIEDIVCEEALGGLWVRSAGEEYIREVSLLMEETSGNDLFQLDYLHMETMSEWGDYDLDCSSPASGVWRLDSWIDATFKFTCPEVD